VALTSSHINLIERGLPYIVTEREWEAHGLDEVSTVLRNLGVIGESYAGGFRIVEPRQFVGYYRNRSCSLAIDPRRAELFEDVRRFVAGFPEKQVTAETSATSDEQLHVIDPAILFCSALESAVQAGLPLLYHRFSIATSHPRGRINFTETFRKFQSRGILHKVACESPARQYDPRLTSVLSTVISLLRRDYSIPSGILGRLEIFACLFEGARIYRIPEAKDAAESLIRNYDGWTEVRRVLLLGQAILTSQEQVWDVQLPIAGGECRFCNMDRLWEIAVLTAFQRTWRGEGRTVEYHPYRNRNFTLFLGRGPEIDPDVVAFEAGKPAMIIDAKYSDTEQPAAGDLYQLLCYVRRLKADIGVLVYLSSQSTWHSMVGRAEGNVAIAAGGASTHKTSQGLLQVSGAVCTDYEAAISKA
jgi:hypothetical protein